MRARELLWRRRRGTGSSDGDSDGDGEGDGGGGVRRWYGLRLEGETKLPATQARPGHKALAGLSFLFSAAD